MRSALPGPASRRRPLGFPQGPACGGRVFVVLPLLALPFPDGPPFWPRPGPAPRNETPALTFVWSRRPLPETKGFRGPICLPPITNGENGTAAFCRLPWGFIRGGPTWARNFERHNPPNVLPSRRSRRPSKIRTQKPPVFGQNIPRSRIKWPARQKAGRFSKSGERSSLPPPNGFPSSPSRESPPSSLTFLKNCLEPQAELPTVFLEGSAAYNFRGFLLLPGGKVQLLGAPPRRPAFSEKFVQNEKCFLVPVRAPSFFVSFSAGGHFLFLWSHFLPSQKKWGLHGSAGSPLTRLTPQNTARYLELPANHNIDMVISSPFNRPSFAPLPGRHCLSLPPFVPS